MRRVNVDGITKAELASWKSGDTVLLSGKILTGRDAAHKRIADMLKKVKDCRKGRFHQPLHLLRGPGRCGA